MSGQEGKMCLDVDGVYYSVKSPCSLKSVIAKAPVQKLEPFCIKTCFLLTVEEEEKDPVLDVPIWWAADSCGILGEVLSG